jgi:hypothetical protein
VAKADVNLSTAPPVDGSAFLVQNEGSQIALL